MGERSGGGAIQPGGGGDLRDPESRSDPLAGDHAHGEQVWQGSGRGARQRKGLVSELKRLKIELAAHLLEPPAKKRGTPSRSQKEVMDDIAVIEGKILLADDQLEKLPSEIRFDEAHAGEKLLKLNHEKKRFLDCIKVFVCNSKAEMCRLLLKHYDRPKEVIPALAMIVERTGYMKLEGGRLEVTLRRFTDREIDYAARHL